MTAEAEGGRVSGGNGSEAAEQIKNRFAPVGSTEDFVSGILNSGHRGGRRCYIRPEFMVLLRPKRDKTRRRFCVDFEGHNYAAPDPNHIRAYTHEAEKQGFTVVRVFARLPSDTVRFEFSKPFN